MVGVVVAVISFIVQVSRWDNLQNVRMICSEELYKGASARLPRRKNAPRYDIIEIANRHLFTNKLLTATLHYDVFDRLSIEPSG